MDLIHLVGNITVLVVVVKHLGPEIWNLWVGAVRGWERYIAESHRHDHSACPACTPSSASLAALYKRNREEVLGSK
jgi:hypothetical protein